MIDIQELFNEFISDNSLCGNNDSILLTVSGGIDSAVMLNLFKGSGYNCGIAHCNFHLRGEESDADAAFVKSLAEKYAYPFYTRDFDTLEYARNHKTSVQMAARELRYKWFEKTRQQYHFDFIATAHNQDDVIETFFINLSRGTGIRGLTGIPVKAGKIIRPLLFAPRKDIMDFAIQKDLPFREDSSNATLKYLRNKVRHRLLPIFEEQNPSFRDSLMHTIRKLSEAESLYREKIGILHNNLVKTGKGRTSINITELSKLKSKNTVLYELLSEFNFSPRTVEDITRSFHAEPGKKFFSPTHRLVKDRDELIITVLEKDDKRRYYLEPGDSPVFEPVELDWKIVDNNEKFSIPEDPKIACLDLDLLEFPLILRLWEKGDYFQPLGMQGMKKLSDFFIDEKISLPDKENTWLLACGQKIAWIVGRRIDNRFRVTGSTRQILMIRYLAGKENI